MDVCDEVMFEFINSKPIFGKPNEFNRFKANDTSKEVEHIFHISSFDDEVITDKGVFCAIDLAIDIKYIKIEKFIDETLRGVSSSDGISSALCLRNGFPQEEIHYHQKYLIDISNPAAKKKSIAEFIDKYYQWLEPIRQKMRSPECGLLLSL